MASEQFSRAVRGSGGQPITTSQKGSIQTNNFADGGGFDSTNYPVSVDPAETIQFLMITNAGNIEAEIVTVDGETITLALAGGTGVIDWLEMDSVTFTDPNNTGARIAGMWGGE